MNPNIPTLVDATMQHKNDLTLRILPDARHDFFNESKKGLYNRAAAEEAWRLTEWFLAETLGPAAGRGRRAP